LALKDTKFRKIMQKFICDFLLVINGNLHSILHCFQVKSNFPKQQRWSLHSVIPLHWQISIGHRSKKYRTSHENIGFIGHIQCVYHCNTWYQTSSRTYKLYHIHFPHWLFCVSDHVLEDIGATHAVHLRLIGKHVVDFLLVIIELFARCYGCSATREHRLKIGNFASTGSVWPKTSSRRGRTNHTSSQKTRMNDLSCGIHMWEQVSFVLSQCKCLADGQRDRWTTERPLQYCALHYMQLHGKTRGSAIAERPRCRVRYSFRQK